MIFAQLLGGPLDGLIVAAPASHTRLEFGVTAEHLGGVLTYIPADPFERRLRPDLPVVRYKDTGVRGVDEACPCPLCSMRRYAFVP